MKNILHAKVKLILPIFACLFCSCTDNYIFVRYTIPPPPPDTTKISVRSDQVGPDIIQADSSRPAVTGNKPFIWPPEPDTTGIISKNHPRIGRIEVLYYLSTPVKSDHIAYIMDSDNRTIDSTIAISGDKPVSLLYGKYYPTRAVFQLNTKVKSPVVKVTVPNQPAFPDGDEIFYIRFE